MGQNGSTIRTGKILYVQEGKFDQIFDGQPNWAKPLIEGVWNLASAISKSQTGFGFPVNGKTITEMYDAFHMANPNNKIGKALTKAQLGYSSKVGSLLFKDKELSFQVGQNEIYSLSEDAQSFLIKKYQRLMKDDAIFRQIWMVFDYLESERESKQSRLIDPAFIMQLQENENSICGDKLRKELPVKVPGLHEILFPGKNEEGNDRTGFDNPKYAHKMGRTVPKIILIKGRPGTGKTTVAIQMLVSMLEAKLKCAYWLTNDDEQSIVNQIISFDLLEGQSPAQVRTYFKELRATHLHIYPIENGDYQKIINGNKDTGHMENPDVVFIDSINVSRLTTPKIKRPDIASIFHKYKSKNHLTVILLEDYGSEGTELSRESISDCEFLADTVIELGEKYRCDYHTRVINIAKQHFNTHAHGNHFFKICTKDHSLKNIVRSSGMIVYPSIHNYISESRAGEYDQEKLVHTGISHLDSILNGGKDFGDINGKTINVNSCIVLRGTPGVHKGPLGLNILLGGLWSIDDQNNFCEGKDALIISLEEETNSELHRIAMAFRTNQFSAANYSHGCIDNGPRITWRMSEPINVNETDTLNGSDKNEWSGTLGHLQERGKCSCKSFFDEAQEYGLNARRKVHFHKWCAHINGSEAENREESKKIGCRKVVIASFRPGCITPEEFLKCVEQILIESTQDGSPGFSRVLFNSTALIHNRFPLLRNEDLFLPALVDLFKSKSVMSIFIDPLHQDIEQDYSRGLVGSADYILNLKRVRENDILSSSEKKLNLDLPTDYKDEIESHPKLTKLIEKSIGNVWSELLVENLKGKVYTQNPHLVTVFTYPNEEREQYGIKSTVRDYYPAKPRDKSEDRINELLIIDSSSVSGYNHPTKINWK